MSGYGWERGTITIPVGQMPALRAVMREAAHGRTASLVAEIDTVRRQLRSLSPHRRRVMTARDIGEHPALQRLTPEAHRLLLRPVFHPGTGDWLQRPNPCRDPAGCGHP